MSKYLKKKSPRHIKISARHKSEFQRTITLNSLLTMINGQVGKNNNNKHKQIKKRIQAVRPVMQFLRLFFLFFFLGGGVGVGSGDGGWLSVINLLQ